MNFSSLDLAPEILQALDACGYSKMTPIQQQAIVPARRGKDLLANAQTGTGKTAAFAIPILQQMIDNPKETIPGHPRCLILTPTRELAEQLAHTIKGYTQFLSFSIAAIYGGTNMDTQKRKLQRGVDIVIATPGRILEHVVQCNTNLSKVEFVVLDEADRMLDMGFISDVHTLLQQTAKKHQTLLFSATVSATVNTLAKELLNRHETVRADKQNTTAATVEHVVYPVEERMKIELFCRLLNQYNWFQVLVFTSTKEQADLLMAKLKTKGVPAAVCHGDKTQGSRRRALADFKAAKTQVLIATEVAARGLDIQGLEYVINYNLPYLAEDYVHRIGRTGRAGANGFAISFVSREEERALSDIERLIGNKIKRIHLKGFEVSNREPLRKSLSKKVYTPRSNKSGRTKILRDTDAQNPRADSAKKPGINKSGPKKPVLKRTKTKTAAPKAKRNSR